MLLSFLYYLCIKVLQSIEAIVLVYIIMGWAVAILRPRMDSKFMKVYFFLSERLEPVFTFCRQFIPPIMGLDLSPILVFLSIKGAKYLIYLLFLLLKF